MFYSSLLREPILFDVPPGNTRRLFTSLWHHKGLAISTVDHLFVSHEKNNNIFFSAQHGTSHLQMNIYKSCPCNDTRPQVRTFWSLCKTVPLARSVNGGLTPSPRCLWCVALAHWPVFSHPLPDYTGKEQSTEGDRGRIPETPFTTSQAQLKAVRVIMCLGWGIMCSGLWRHRLGIRCRNSSAHTPTEHLDDKTKKPSRKQEKEFSVWRYKHFPWDLWNAQQGLSDLIACF